MCLKELSGNYESTVEWNTGKQIYSVHLDGLWQGLLRAVVNIIRIYNFHKHIQSCVHSTYSREVSLDAHSFAN